jgi:outer membrane protein TolC
MRPGRPPAGPRPWLAAAVGLLGLAGCAAPTPPQPQDAATLAAREGLDADARVRAAPADAPAPAAADLRWWARFDDPALARWVDGALAASLDIALARTRIDEARAALRAAQGARAPQLTAVARVDARSRAAADGRRVDPTLQLALDWDADLWGGLRDAERAAAATLAGRAFDARALQLSTAALTARAYLAWQQSRLDRAAQEDALALWRETARVVQVRVDAGLSPRLDGLRAEAEVAAAEAALVAAGTRVREAERALQLLAGDRPGAAFDGRGADGPPRLPIPPGAAGATGPAAAPGATGAAAGASGGAAPPPLPVVLPLDLLRLRPDLRAAEQALRAAAAELGVASAAERPSLRLPGMLTLGSSSGGTALAALAAGVAAELAAPLFDGGRRAAARDVAAARLRAAEIAYRRELRIALAQAEAAFVAHADARRALAAQADATRAAESAERQARTLYDNGLVGFLDLLEAQRDALARRQALIGGQADLARSAVAAFEAMGLLPEAGG